MILKLASGYWCGFAIACVFVEPNRVMFVLVGFVTAAALYEASRS